MQEQTEYKERGEGSIERVLNMLEAISTFRGEWFELPHLSDKAGIPRATIRLYIRVLVERGYIEQDGRKYRHIRKV